MKVIFLDIDGVLNYEKSQSRCCGFTGIDHNRVKNLAKIVAATDAKIVLISTWREYYFLNAGRKQPDKTGQYLYNKLAQEHLYIYDILPKRARWANRGNQIQAYLDDHPEIDGFVILDDEIFVTYLQNGLERYLIQSVYDTDREEFGGLTEYLADRAIEILNTGPVADGPVMDKNWADFWELNFNIQDYHKPIEGAH